MKRKFPFLCRFTFLFYNERQLNILKLTIFSTGNIALHKPAYQQHPVPDDDLRDASNAVDGRKSNLRLWGGQCAVSNLETMPPGGWT